MTTATDTPQTDTKAGVLLRNYYPHDLPVDGVNGDETIPLRVRRFTHGQLREFMAGWSRVENPPHERAIYRKPDEAADLDMGEVRRRRVAEMDDATRQAFEAQERQDIDHNVDFCQQQIRAHVWVAPGAKVVFEDGDGDTRAIKTGDDLVHVFGGNVEMLLTMTGILMLENTLGGQKKRTWRSRLASRASSSTPPPAADGTKPAATAASAAPPASASPEAASVSPAPTPSTETT